MLQQIFHRRTGPLVLLLILPLSSFAQSKGSLIGRLLDQNSAAISGVAVNLRQASSSYELTVTTDAQGRFRFDSLPAADYLLVIKHTGFGTLEKLIHIPSSNIEAEVVYILEPASIAESVVITSGHVLTSAEMAERIPGSIEIINAQVLENTRALTSTEVLRKFSGVNVRDEEGLGLRPNVGIRGLNPTRSTKVLLLEDGIPLTYAPYGDNASYYHPPVERFESIEVLKGSGQILYGPQTIGGVINYISPNLTGKCAAASTPIGGNRHYFNGHLSYGATYGNSGLLIRFTRKQGEGSRQNVRSGPNDFTLKSVTTF